MPATKFHTHTGQRAELYFYNTARCPVWVWNLVAEIEGGTLAEGDWEQGVEESIWAS